MASTACVLPWSHVFIASTGEVFPCCMSQSLSSRIVDDQGNPIKAQDPASIYEAWNSSQMKSIRSSMLKGDRPEACKACYLQEDLGQHSYRQSMNEKFPSSFQQIESNMMSDSPDFRVLSLDLRGSNLCNLKCRMCAPWSSQALRKEWETFLKREFPTKSKGLSFAVSQFFLEHASSVEHIRLAGGEPLLMEDLHSFLEALVQQKESSHIDLSFNTNLTFLQEKHLELWKSFRKVKVSVSLDAYGDLNTYIRYPSKWNDIVKNIERILLYSKTVKPLTIRIQTTVLIYNIFKLKDLVRFLYSQYSIFPQINILSSPLHMNIQALPMPLKEKAYLCIQELEEEFPEMQDLKALKEFIFLKDQSEHFPKFWEWTNFFDQSRNQKISDYVPELQENAK